MSMTPAIATGLPKGRRWKKVRFPCGPHLSASLFLKPTGGPEPVTVRNLSGIGISLLLSDNLEPGTVGTLALVNRATGFGCQVAMRVVSSVPQPDGQIIGEAVFTRELRNVEVQGLLPEILE